jgi:secondary thiamine-phosphate synthase enzyme
MVVREEVILTKKYNEFIVITGKIEEAVSKSGIKNGLVTVMTKHTTTGIMINEALECVESDIENFLSKIIPEDYPYSHARILHDYGSTAGNPTGHLKSFICGNHCHFPIINGKAVRGKAQDVYFCEFDGPAQRAIMIIISEL